MNLQRLNFIEERLHRYYKPFRKGEDIDYTSPEYTERQEDNDLYYGMVGEDVRELVEEVRDSWWEIHDLKMQLPQPKYPLPGAEIAKEDFSYDA
jgi:hypothetical protein